MSAFKITDKVAEKVEEILSFSKNPLFEKSDIECVSFALRAYQEGGLDWLRYRARLFDNPDIVTHAESALDGIRQKEKTT